MYCKAGMISQDDKTEKQKLAGVLLEAKATYVHKTFNWFLNLHVCCTITTY